MFLVESRALLQHADRLENLGRRLGRGEEGGLCIGYVADAIHTGILPGALRALHDAQPDVHIALYNLSPGAQFEGLRQRSLDIALVHQPPPADDPDLVAAPLFRDPLLLAVPAKHPLVGKAEIAPGDLDGLPWIAIENAQDPAWRDAFVASCAAAGFTPDIRLDAAEPLTALGLVASGLGLALVPKSMASATTEDIEVRELPWHDGCVQLWAAWHHIDLRPVVTSFRTTVLGTRSAE